MATYSNNTTIKVQGTITAGSVVPANSYAIASYNFIGYGIDLAQNQNSNAMPGGGFQVHYGPGSTVLGQIQVGTYYNPSNPSSPTIRYASLVVNAVLFQNTP